MASPATSETDGRQFDGNLAPRRSPAIVRDRSRNFSTLVEVYNRQKELEQGLDEPILAGSPPPDLETMWGWASALQGHVYFVQNDRGVRKGPQTLGAEKRLALLQKTGC